MSSTDGIPYLNDGGLTWSGDSSNIGIDFLTMDKDGNIYAGWVAVYKSSNKGMSWTIIKDSLYVWSFYINSGSNLLAGTHCGFFYLKTMVLIGLELDGSIAEILP